jgi:hypothetical protein
VTRGLAAAALLLFAACAGNRSAPETRSGTGERASDHPPARSSESVAAPWRGGTELTSNDGAWKVVYKVDDPGIRRGEPFDLDAWVFGPDDASKPRADVSLAVDAAMPQHGHGMNRVPKIEKLPDGGFRAEGLLFHMPGKWELYFDVARGPLVERAQADVEVE